MTTHVECINFIAGDIASITEWLNAHSDITVIHIEFQSPFAYIIYTN